MNRTKLLLITCLSIVLVLSLVFAGCGPQPAEKILKVGALYPVSGPAAAFGVPLTRGTQLFAELINDAGGVKAAGDTYKFEIVSLDTKFTPEGSVAAINTMAYTEKIKFVTGGMTGFEVLAMQPTVEKEKMLLLSDGFPPSVVSPDKPHCFRVAPSPHEIVPTLYSWIHETYPDLKRVSLFNDNTESGHACAADAESFCQLIGLEVVGKEFYEVGTQDFYPIINKILPTKPDLIGNGSAMPPEFALFVKQCRELGYKGLFEFEAPFPTNELLGIAGAENAEGFVGVTRVTEGPMATDAAKAFRKAYTDKYGEWDDTAIDIPIGIPILAEAIDLANSLDVDKVCAVLDSGRSFDTALGPVKFGGERVYGIAHQLIMPICPTQMKNGVPVPMKVVGVEEQLELLKTWEK